MELLLQGVGANRRPGVSPRRDRGSPQPAQPGPRVLVAPGPRLLSEVPYRAGPTPGARVVPRLLPGRSPSSTPNLPHKSREWLRFTTRAAFAHRHPRPPSLGPFVSAWSAGPASGLATRACALCPLPTLLAAVTEPRGRSSCQSPGAPSASGWGTEEREAEGLREEGGAEQQRGGGAGRDADTHTAVGRPSPTAWGPGDLEQVA